MTWQVKLQTDIIKGQWSETYKACLYYEFHYIIAQCGKEAYIHTYPFQDNWERTNELLKRIRSAPNFSPKNNPQYWCKIVDLEPITAWKREWRRLLSYKS